MRERPAGLLLVDALEGLDEAGEVVRRQLDVLRCATRGLQRLELLLEAMGIDAVDRFAVHLDQPAVGVVGEARVARRRREARNSLVTETDVEDRVHHPGHRDRRARADGDEQRISRVAEPLLGLLLEAPDVFVDLALQAVRQQPPACPIRAARLGRDREAGGNGHAERGHLRQPDSLPAEQLAPAVAGVVEGVDVAHYARIFPQRRRSQHPVTSRFGRAAISAYYEPGGF